MASPQCSLSREYPVAVRVDGAALRKLDGHLKAFAARVHYSADLVDGSSIRFSGLDQLLTFDNPRSRAIRSLRASSSGDGSATVTITEKTDLWKPVALSVTGADEDVAPLVARIEKWIDDARQGHLYTMFARPEPVNEFETPTRISLVS